MQKQIFTFRRMGKKSTCGVKYACIIAPPLGFGACTRAGVTAWVLLKDLGYCHQW